ncbi:universal stress protein [Streptomyces sp. AV19]|uniref:universal stress protein n=1 Tax=Streptomyces sp. AV19 TaxID=2793068 RepID=UPI0018FF06E8|nr:universal stress protein [Streptomyces sp. AV19]MBH1934513.1 universal stress protein [Streptomyces sp. AV19]MDG4533307.1 universal stress protein [Streptomyces sp. AV19]
MDDRMTDRTPRVVVGVDGSPNSVVALRTALAEARRRAAELYAVTAYLPVDGGWAIGPGPAPDPDRRKAAAALERTCRSALGTDPGGAPLTAAVVRGPARHVLTDLADRPQDLLVVGLGRQGPLRRLLRSSVARDCVRHARCPLLLVPPSGLARDYRKGLRRWNGWLGRQADDMVRTALDDDGVPRA